jgi:uncharacterized protein (DUF58 family)
LDKALEFLMRVQAHKAVAVVISDFITADGGGVLPRTLQTSLRMANRKHDVVAVQITDRHELQLPALGRLTLEDAETGEVVELNTGSASSRDAFALRQERQLGELARQFRSARIDSIQLRTNESYTAALGQFFEAREKRRLRG